MQIDEARQLRAALDGAIARAEAVGDSNVDLAGELEKVLGGTMQAAPSPPIAGQAGGGADQPT